MVGVVLATVRSVEQHNGWYYIACRKHNKKVVKRHEFGGLEDIDAEVGEEDGSLYCSRCNGKASSMYPRFLIHILIASIMQFMKKKNYVSNTFYLHSYKVQVRVQDSIGSTSFVLFNKDIFRLIHKHAVELRDKQVMVSN